MRQISTAALAADVDVCPCPAGGIAALASPVGGVVDRRSHWLSRRRWCVACHLAGSIG